MNAPWFGRYARRLMLDVLLHVTIATMAGVLVFLVVDFVEVGNRASIRAKSSDFAQLSFYSIPRVFHLLAMVTAPIGVLTAVGAQARRLEVVAFFAAGAAPMAVFKPLLVVGAFVAGVYAANMEWFVPPSASKTQVIRRRMGLPTPVTERRANTWFKGKTRVYRVRALDDPTGRTLSDVLMLELDQGRVTDRWDVAQLNFTDGKWTGRTVVHRRLDADDRVQTARAEALDLDLFERPQDFVTEIAAPERLGYSALAATTAARERVGRPAIGHRLELYRRYATPLTLMLAMVLASAVGLRLGRRQSLAVSLGAGASVGFFVWMLIGFCGLIGAAGTISPGAAAHTPLVITLGALVTFAMQVHRRGIAEG